MGRKFKDVLDSLVDDEGLKTEVNITMTNRTLINLVAGLVVAGGGIVTIVYMARKWFPNQEIVAIKEQLTEVKQALTANG